MRVSIRGERGRDGKGRIREMEVEGMVVSIEGERGWMGEGEN